MAVLLLSVGCGRSVVPRGLGDGDGGTAELDGAQCLENYYLDSDGDGFGGTSATVSACVAPANYVPNHLDCDDDNAARFPGSTEQCGDHIDNDCDGQVDEDTPECRVPTRPESETLVQTNGILVTFPHIEIGGGGSVLTISQGNGVYVFQQDHHEWRPLQTLFPEHDLSALSSMSDNGSRIALAEPWAWQDTPSVRVFRHNGTEYELEVTLSEEFAANFGKAIELSGDGRTLAVAQSGAVTIYRRTDSVWRVERRLSTLNECDQNDPTQCLALSADGERLVVPSAGVVTIYARNGSSWDAVDELDLSGVVSLATAEAVALASDGQSLAIGVPTEMDSAGNQVGGVYVYLDSGSGFRLDQHIVASDASAIAWFGASVDFNSNADRLVVGAPFQSFGDECVCGERSIGDGGFYGEVHVFDRSDAGWNDSMRIIAADFKNDSGFGTSVSIANDNSLLAILSRRPFGDVEEGTGHIFPLGAP